MTDSTTESRSTWLSDDEVKDATRRAYPAHQARVLEGWRVPFQRRPDGTIMVSRAALDAALSGATMPGKKAANGLNWSKSA